MTASLSRVEPEGVGEIMRVETGGGLGGVKLEDKDHGHSGTEEKVLLRKCLWERKKFLACILVAMALLAAGVVIIRNLMEDGPLEPYLPPEPVSIEVVETRVGLPECEGTWSEFCSEDSNTIVCRCDQKRYFYKGGHWRKYQPDWGVEFVNSTADEEDGGR